MDTCQTCGKVESYAHENRCRRCFHVRPITQRDSPGLRIDSAKLERRDSTRGIGVWGTDTRMDWTMVGLRPRCILPSRRTVFGTTSNDESLKTPEGG